MATLCRKIRVISSSSSKNYRLQGEKFSQLSLANEFLDLLEARDMSPDTIRAYAYDLLFLFRAIQTRKISKSEWYIGDFAPLLRLLREQEMSPNSINRRLTTCRLFLDFELRSRNSKKALLRRDESTTPLPMKNWRVRLPVKLVKTLSPEEVSQFVKGINCYRNLAIIALMLFGGLRSCEVLNLKISQLDANERNLRIIGKGRKERVIPLRNEAFEALDRYLKYERPPLSETNHLFVVLKGNKRGQPMKASGLRSLFRYRRKKCKIENANPHRFRHTFGTDLAKSGLGLPILQKLMGHSHPNTTLQYIHFSLTDLHTEYQKALQTIGTLYEDASF
jgi:site-specific recombinase XerD